MKIAVNTRLLLKNKLEGIGWFTFETLKRITLKHPEHSFLYIFDRPFDPSFISGKNVQGIVVPPPARHPLLWYTWFEVSLPKALKTHKASMFFSPDGYMPLNLKIPSLITVHDINFHHRPGDFPLSSRIYYRRLFPLFTQKADRIVTVSEFSKKDIISSYGINADKIDVVFNGANEVYSPLSGEMIEQVRQSLTGWIPYFVFIGSMHPRKNIHRLFMAFDQFRKNFSPSFKLVIIGEKMFMTGEIEKAFRKMTFSGDVIFGGRLPPEKLHHVLGASSGLSYVPLYEGFGIPMLEAMHCDIPILASNVTALPEIAGDAAIYADPMSVESIADGMRSLAVDTELRKRLIAKGRARRSVFSWDQTAYKLWSSFEKIMPID